MKYNHEDSQTMTACGFTLIEYVKSMQKLEEISSGNNISRATEKLENIVDSDKTLKRLVCILATERFLQLTEALHEAIQHSEKEIDKIILDLQAESIEKNGGIH